MTWVPIYHGQEACTGADGASINNRAPVTEVGASVSPGYGPWVNGTGLYALGASVQGDEFARTSAGGGSQEVHLMLHASGFIRDQVFHCVDVSRPADASNQQRGLVVRNNNQQFNSGTNEGLYIYWDRVSAAAVDIKFLLKVAGSIVQGPTTVLAGLALAENGGRLCLGCYLDDDQLQIFRAPARASRDLMAPSPDERVALGAPVTLVNALNDDNHRFTGAFGRLVTSGGTWDNFATWVDRDISAPSRVVVR